MKMPHHDIHANQSCGQSSQSNKVSCDGIRAAVSSTMDLPAKAMSLLGWVELGKLLNQRLQMVN